MTRLIAMTGATLALVLLAGDTARAETWQRNWTGPYGVDRSATVHCGPYGCGYNMHATGPNGATWSRSGGAWAGPYRGFSYRSVTGPAGNSYAVGRAWRRY
jgi:hypothetical protein